MARKTPADNEQLPVNAARPMAFISVGMSVGFALLVYVVFFKGVFSGNLALLVLLTMLVMTAVSCTVALKNVGKRIRCSRCQAPFFTALMPMFAKPERCGSCQQPLTINVDSNP